MSLDLASRFKDKQRISLFHHDQLGYPERLYSSTMDIKAHLTRSKILSLQWASISGQIDLPSQYHFVYSNLGLQDLSFHKIFKIFPVKNQIVNAVSATINE